MTIKKLFLSPVIFGIACSMFAITSAYTYEIETHIDMSENAAIQSSLNSYLPTIGLKTLNDPLVDINTSKKIVDWIKSGADHEDDLLSPNFARFRNHFFDPLTGLGLNTVITGEPSPDWGLEDTRTFITQSYSFKDARQSLYDALTLPSKDNREMWMARTFYTLGHVIHLIQDMAQPQHVRNDIHPSIGSRKSLYEEYTNEHRGTLPYTNTDYDASTQVKFGKARDFWTTTINNNNGQGMAEFTNRNFVSAGTNFNSGKYTSPAINPILTQLPKKVKDLCLEPGVVCTPVMNAFPEATITFYGNDVVDQYNPASNKPNLRASSESVFDQFLEEAGRAKAFTLNSFNFDAAHEFLIPRAVSYSAGLINYFFRGKMTISLPDEGVYGLVDHSVFANTNPISNFNGFNKIKLKLSNTSPNAEAMSGGKLLAVLKFRRNSCYKDDLSGQPPFVSWSACRTAEEEVVVSNTMDNVVLSSAPQPFEFNFAKALPINATDVYLQLVYRGNLGQEIDAVVVATQDISEPTFFSYMNASDYIRLGTKVYTPSEINTDPDLINQVRPTSCVDFTLSPPQLQASCFNPFLITKTFTLGGKTTIQINGMQQKQFLRFAFLSDASPSASPPPTLLEQNGPCLPLTPFSIPPLIWQDTYDTSANTLTRYYPIFQKIRGVSGHYGTSCISNGDDSAPGTPDERNAMMLDVDSQVPVAVQITP